MSQLVSWIGGLLPAWLLGMLFKWILRRIGRTENVIVPAHLIAMFIGTALSAFGRANGGSPDFVGGAIQAIPPQIAWLAFDLFRQSRTTKDHVGT